jgi:hypothetical protein
MQTSTVYQLIPELRPLAPYQIEAVDVMRSQQTMGEAGRMSMGQARPCGGQDYRR